MTLLLAADPVELYLPGREDSHGWARDTAPPVLAWEGLGNLQETPGRSDPQAAGGGGHGPSDPAITATGVLYLPPEADPYDGMTAVVRETRWVLGQVRFSRDPGLGHADCWTATVSEVTW